MPNCSTSHHVTEKEREGRERVCSVNSVEANGKRKKARGKIKRGREREKENASISSYTSSFRMFPPPLPPPSHFPLPFLSCLCCLHNLSKHFGERRRQKGGRDATATKQKKTQNNSLSLRRNNKNK